MISLNKLIGLAEPVVLASASPRRKQLLEQLGLTFLVQPSSVDEGAVSVQQPPDEYVRTLALHKARDIARHQPDSASVVIGADTVVVYDNRILNKPFSPAEAQTMLQTLSGRTHTVYTGVALVSGGATRELTAIQSTEVTFRELTEREITAYVATGSPLDKAGAYGIQDDFGAVFVEKIQGCYYNVVGLPLSLLYTMLTEFCGDSHEQGTI